MHKKLNKNSNLKLLFLVNYENFKVFSLISKVPPTIFFKLQKFAKNINKQELQSKTVLFLIEFGNFKYFLTSKVPPINFLHKKLKM